ncbi:hypothetical protein [Nonomuraea sp. SYSU D8015]|uniref:hypothetical protein n=1 Tax=Nonomuraea sp. SYSU D8015 TaxID=2593644 RepID=UPI0016612EEE|nr:hypothetical protein [Nonomuraea sp. SYSU D8015]
MKLILYRALLTLDPAAYPSGDMAETTRSGVIRVPGHTPDKERQFPAIIATADNEPFQVGEKSREVRISVTDETAPDYLTTGVGFELWSSQQPIGHGIITRRAFV